MENSVGVRDLKAQLSKYLRMVQSGVSITITDHGKPVGKLIPLEKNTREQINQMVNNGLANWNGQQVAERKPIVYNTSNIRASDLIDEERR